MARLFRDVARGLFVMQHGRFAMRKTCCWGVRVCSVALLIAVFMGVQVAHAQAGQAGTQGRGMSMVQVDEGQASAMMAERQQMMNAMHAMDHTLKDLVAKMDAASGSAV
jgi:hypothetical protein